MPNYNKSFNFRNGVQVDEDDLIVRSSLVGIGTTVPTTELDVYGDTRVTGLTTTNKLYVTGVSTYIGDVNIGTGITISASTGIISATKIFGDGSSLVNLPTSQWVDVDPGIGFTSIYAQGNVGVGTTNPSGFSLQIGGPDDGSPGVGINTTGNIRATGIVTAARFVGTGITAVSDFKVGANATVGITTILDEDDLGSNSATALVTQQSVKAYIDAQVTAQDVDIATDSGTVDIDLDSETLTIAGTSKEIETSGSGTTVTIGLPNTIEISKDLKVAGIGTVVNLDTTYANVSGVTTSRSLNATYLNVSAASTLGVTTFTDQVSLKHLNVSGVSTFAGKLVLSSPIDANESLDVDGQAELDDINVSGVSTFVGLGTFKGGLKVSGGDGFVATTAKIGDLTDNRVVIAGTSGELEDSGNLTFDGYTLNVGSGVTISSDHLDITGVTTSTKIQSGTVQIGYGGGNEIDTSAGNLVIDSDGGTVTVDDNLTVAGITTGQSTFAKNISVSGVTSSTQFRSGTVRVTNNKVDTVSGNLSLGAALGTVDIDNNLSVTGFATVTQALLPDVDKGATVGSATKAFTSAHVNEVRIGAGATNEIDTRGGNLVLDAASNVVQVDSNLTVVNGTVLTGIATIGNSLVPVSDQGAVLGGASARFSGLYVDNVRIGTTSDQTIDTLSGDLKLNSATGKVEVQDLVVTGTVDHVGVSTVSTGLSPDIDKGAYLGQATKSFSEAYIDEVTVGVANTNAISTREGDLRLDAASNNVNVQANFEVDAESKLKGNVYTGDSDNSFYVNASNNKVGFGTNIPSSQVEFVKDTGDITVEVVSRDGSSTIGLGQSIGIGNSTGTVAYDGTNLVIANRSDSGDINLDLSTGTGINTSSYVNVKYDNATVLAVGYSGGVGVNKDLPTTALDVAGSVAITENVSVTGILTVGTGSNQVTLGSDDNIYQTWGKTSVGISTIISVGIGTTNPTERLTVEGTIKVGDTSISSGIVTSSNPGVTTVTYYGDGSKLTNIAVANQQWSGVANGSYHSALSNVGIGTTNPTSNLTVDGNQNVTGNLFLDNHMTSNLGIRTDAVYTDSRVEFKIDVTTNGTVSSGSTVVTGISTVGLREGDGVKEKTDAINESTIIANLGVGQINLNQPSAVPSGSSTTSLDFGVNLEGTPALRYGELQHFGDAAFIGAGSTGNSVVFVPSSVDNSETRNIVSYNGSGIGTALWNQSIVGINTYVPRSTLDLGASKGYFIPPHHDAATRTTTLTNNNPYIDPNTRDIKYSNDPDNTEFMPDVVDGSLVFYTPKNRLEIGINTYATNQEQIAGGGDNEFVQTIEDKQAATVAANTTNVGIDTIGIVVGMEVAYESNMVAFDTKVQSIGAGSVTLTKATTNSSVESNKQFGFGYYDHLRQTKFYGIPTLGVSNDGEYLQPPSITTTQRDTMTDASTLDGDEFQGGTGRGGKGYGAIIYNTTSDRLEVFLKGDGTGGAWCGIATVA